MPSVVTIPGVMIVRTGTYEISTGPWSPNADDLRSAVAAHRAGVLRKPVIKLGHQGPMRDAAPALGHLDNLRTTDGGTALLADLVDVPRALAAVIGKAFPSRSIEALLDYQAPDGTVWSLVVTGLAVLGATEPGIPNLASLPDVLDLYGVAAASARRVVMASMPAGATAAERARAVAVARARRTRTYRLTTT